MNENSNASQRPLGSDLARVDAHEIQAVGHEEIPELSEEMLKVAVIKKAGEPVVRSADEAATTPHRDEPA